MKKIAINLNDSIYSALCVRGEANNRTPEMEATAILLSVCQDVSRLPIIKNIEEVIQGESGVAVYTYSLWWEESFFLDVDNDTGYTGDWIAYASAGETVIIYNGRTNLIYKGRITKTVQSSKDTRRRKIHFENWEIVGTTRSMWKDFAKTGSNPVKYFYGGKA